MNTQHYSVRKQRIGSIEAARRDGTRLAMRDTRIIANNYGSNSQATFVTDAAQEATSTQAMGYVQSFPVLGKIQTGENA
jgi:hypothetical protein